MGNALFGVDVAGLVARHIGPGVLPVVLSEPRSAARDPAKLTGGRVPLDPILHDARGFWEDFTGKPPPDVLVTDRKGIVLGDTLPAGVVPDSGWSMTCEGVTLRIVRRLSRDPAAAVYAFVCRDAAGPDKV